MSKEIRKIIDLLNNREEQKMPKTNLWKNLNSSPVPPKKDNWLKIEESLTEDILEEKPLGWLKDKIEGGKRRLAANLGDRYSKSIVDIRDLAGNILGDYKEWCGKYDRGMYDISSIHDFLKIKYGFDPQRISEIDIEARNRAGLKPSQQTPNNANANSPASAAPANTNTPVSTPAPANANVPGLSATPANANVPGSSATPANANVPGSSATPANANVPGSSATQDLASDNTTDTAPAPANTPSAPSIVVPKLNDLYKDSAGTIFKITKAPDVSFGEQMIRRVNASNNRLMHSMQLSDFNNMIKSGEISAYTPNTATESFRSMKSFIKMVETYNINEVNSNLQSPSTSYSNVIAKKTPTSDKLDVETLNKYFNYIATYISKNDIDISSATQGSSSTQSPDNIANTSGEVQHSSKPNYTNNDEPEEDNEDEGEDEDEEGHTVPTRGTRGQSASSSTATSKQSSNVSTRNSELARQIKRDFANHWRENISSAQPASKISAKKIDSFMSDFLKKFPNNSTSEGLSLSSVMQELITEDEPKVDSSAAKALTAEDRKMIETIFSLAKVGWTYLNSK